MKFFITMIICFCSFFPSLSHAVDADYSFIPVKGDNVVGYHIYYVEVLLNPETASTMIVSNGTVGDDGRVHCTISNLKEGKTYLFTVAAIDTNAVEGAMSYVLQFIKNMNSFPGPMHLTKDDAFQARIKLID